LTSSTHSSQHKRDRTVDRPFMERIVAYSTQCSARYDYEMRISTVERQETNPIFCGEFKLRYMVY
jgi:hypothetical protein